MAITRARVILTSAVLVCLCLAAPASAEPTCRFPWTEDHDYFAHFEVGASYRSPYAEIIQVLARVCLVKDGIQQDDGTVTTRCAEWGFAVRNVQGTAIKTLVGRTVVWVNGQVLAQPNGIIPESWYVTSWGKLPPGCVPPVTVISTNEAGAVLVSQTR